MRNIEHLWVWHYPPETKFDTFPPTFETIERMHDERETYSLPNWFAAFNSDEISDQSYAFLVDVETREIVVL